MKIFYMLTNLFCIKREKMINWPYRALRKCFTILANVYAIIFLNPYFRLKRLNPKSSHFSDKQLIVSLTSFPPRIKKLPLTIETIFSQKTVPDRIILWLAKEQFPNGLESLPKSLIKQQNRGLEIRFCDDLRPHKKYYYTFSLFPNDIIVTLDDDILYPPNTVSSLIEGYRSKPNAIHCNRAKRISFETITGHIETYNNWSRVYTPSYGHDLVAIGISGVLYCPNLFDDELFNKKRLKRLALNADDLWLKVHEIRNNVPVNATNFTYQYLITVFNSQKHALLKQNVIDNKNDEQFKGLIEEYEINHECFKGSGVYFL